MIQHVDYRREEDSLGNPLILYVCVSLKEHPSMFDAEATGGHKKKLHLI